MKDPVAVRVHKSSLLPVKQFHGLSLTQAKDCLNFKVCKGSRLDTNQYTMLCKEKTLKDAIRKTFFTKAVNHFFLFNAVGGMASDTLSPLVEKKVTKAMIGHEK